MEYLTFFSANFSSDKVAASPVRPGTKADHDEFDSWCGCTLHRTSVTHTPVRNAILTVSTARGIKSLSDRQQLTATAASIPVQRPATRVFESGG
jgi:hypothetical protein